MKPAEGAFEIAVVIPAVNSAGLLRRTLKALVAQPRPERLEIVVVDRLEPGETNSIRADFPDVAIVPGKGLTIPQMRSEGIRESRSSIVAVLEDHMEVTTSWQDAILHGHSLGADAVGGPVTNGCDGVVDWAAFFTEYSDQMTPMPEGTTSSLPGSNVAYKRASIEQCRDLFFSGLWETFVHDELARRGAVFRREAGAEVVNAKPFSASHFASQRWHLARSYAGMRARRMGLLERLARALAAPLILPLRAARIVGRVRRRPQERYRKALRRCLPWLLVFLCIWAAGDVAGYLVGEGDSTLRVT